MFHQSVPGNSAHARSAYVRDRVASDVFAGGIVDVVITALEARGRDQALFFHLPRDFLCQGDVQREGLFHKEGNAPADGFEFDPAVAGGRHAEENHIGLRLVEHLSEIRKRFAAARLLNKGFRPLQHQVAKACQVDILKLQKMAEVVFANAAAADHSQLFHARSSCSSAKILSIARDTLW